MNVFLESSEVPKPPYEVPNSPVKALSLSMRLEDLCRKHNLLGLSAPQIGVPWNLFVYCDTESSSRAFNCLMDCVYSGEGEKMLSFESCATFQDGRFAVMRYPLISVSALGITEKDGRMTIHKVDDKFSGLTAAIIQHESDHMKGISPEESGERKFFK